MCEIANTHQADSGLSLVQQLQSLILGEAQKGLEVTVEDTRSSKHVLHSCTLGSRQSRLLCDRTHCGLLIDSER